MRDYPPEYDKPHAVALPANSKPSWVDEFWWDEDGKVVAQLSKTGVMRGVGSAEEESEAISLCVTWLDRYDALVERVAKAQNVEGKPMPDGWWADLWKVVHEMYGLEPSKFDLAYGVRPDLGQKPVFYNDDADVGDTYPLWCSECDTYHERAYSYSFGKDGYGLFVQVGTWDGNDWGYEYAYESDAEWLFRHMNIDHYFADWSDYYLYQFRTGLDPLEVWYKVPSDDDILEAVEDNLNHIK